MSGDVSNEQLIALKWSEKMLEACIVVCYSFVWLISFFSFVIYSYNNLLSN